MSEVIIDVSNLAKSYRLYRRPVDRIADALGLGSLVFWRKDRGQEFWALNDINLKVKQGERIGLIGRNGAGKSTLLKTICGTVQPSRGSVEVRGQIQALMSLGIGFHSEFTGRQNIRAALAYQGVSSADMERYEKGVIEFAELGDFIDQPVRTYSAGMHARLAFSVATEVLPDVLIVDEVLGAGDSYFASKCLDRMKMLTQRAGTTLLFVSHDLGSVALMCDRCIWIDRGRVRMDGETSSVLKAYSQMIRELRDASNRGRNQMLATATEQSVAEIRDHTIALEFQIRNHENSVLDVQEIRLRVPGFADQVISVGDSQDSSQGYDAHVIIDGKNGWSNPRLDGNRTFRSVSANSLAPVRFIVPGISPDEGAVVSVVCRSESGGSFDLQLVSGSDVNTLSTISIERASSWQNKEQSLSGNTLSNFLTNLGIVRAEHAGEIETGAVRIDRVKFTDKTGRETSTFKSFSDLYVSIDYTVQKNVSVEAALTFYNQGIIALQALSGLQENGISHCSKGEKRCITLKVKDLPLGRGTYLITVGLFPPLDYSSPDTERTAHILHDRRYTIEVEQPEDIRIELGMCRAKLEWKSELHNIADSAQSAFLATGRP